MSSGFNAFERNVAKFLSSNPKLKQVTKFIYQRLSYMLNRKKYTYMTKYKINRVCDNESVESFYGYYDKSPENNKGLILVHETKFPTTNKPSAEENISICVYDRGRKICSVDSNAYNWQQGSRAIWMSDTKFIYNIFDVNSNTYKSQVYCLDKNDVVDTFDLPLQDVFSDEYFLSINYERLMALRPDYGYRNKPMMTDEEIFNIEDIGIDYVNIKTGDIRRIVSINEIINVESTGFKHKFNHIMISPCGKKFIFMHRMLSSSGQRFDHLYLYCFESSEIKLLSDRGMVSHCCWIDSNKILGYMRGDDNQDSYWFIDLENDKTSSFDADIIRHLGDGHPTYNGGRLVVDNYPDKSRMQSLVLYSFDCQRSEVIAELKHNFRYNLETRCDLHPRLSLTGERVFFDSVYEGKRHLYYIDLKGNN
ncbi:glycosyl transferase [Vibrio furnissii]|uniref:glycosyl transferase n=1 Tax=Vibrio furnissii TaxID=29494 RepID=UPI003AA86455